MQIHAILPGLSHGLKMDRSGTRERKWVQSYGFSANNLLEYCTAPVKLHLEARVNTAYRVSVRPLGGQCLILGFQLSLDVVSSSQHGLEEI